MARGIRVARQRRGALCIADAAGHRLRSACGNGTPARPEGSRGESAGGDGGSPQCAECRSAVKNDRRESYRLPGSDCLHTQLRRAEPQL